MLGILTFYFVRGCFKGFLSMIFSLLGVFFVAIVSWKLTAIFLPTVQNFAGDVTFDAIKTFIDGILPGQFSSIEQLELGLRQSKIGEIFGVIVSKLLSNISFDGSLTAGQIFAPTLSQILLTVATFLIIFLLLEILLKTIRFFLNKLIKKCGLSVGNRILGGLLGLAKGLVMFGILFVIISTLANALLSPALLQFVRSGTVSNFLYENLFAKILHIFY